MLTTLMFKSLCGPIRYYELEAYSIGCCVFFINKLFTSCCAVLMFKVRIYEIVENSILQLHIVCCRKFSHLHNGLMFILMFILIFQ